jgi:acetylornithine/succinyldiaminopimelate/putrescine aminotransferase
VIVTIDQGLVTIYVCLQDYPCIGHVRGMGLFVGFELVIPDSQKPAPGTAKFVKEAMKARRVLVSTDGHHNQVIKIKPPMCFDKSNVDTLIANLVDLLKPGVPAAVQEIDRAYDPNKKSTRIQNTTWQAMPANGVQGV